MPKNLFPDNYSTVLYSEQGHLLGAHIASDGQWRFKAKTDVPKNFENAVVQFEDRRFYYHPGVDPIAIIRAIKENIREKNIVSGASTLSMQVIRLHRKGRPRTVLEKLIEMLLAVRLECRYTKVEILRMWSSHAPFGGNVVGLEAAAWRYFGREANKLSWAEASTLAVLPNAPSLIHPGKNRNALLKKRDHVLGLLLEAGLVDETSQELAASEPLPDKPIPLPQIAPHLLTYVRTSSGGGESIVTTINKQLQSEVNQIVERHHTHLSQNEIHNAAVLVLDVKLNTVKAYVGNTRCGPENGEDNDIVHAQRSSGSILKPFLYAAMNQEGSLMPEQLVFDIPTVMEGFRPKNFFDQYDGAVPADEALSRSLNIPAVRMLRDYGVDQYLQVLRDLEFHSIDQSADHYGLSLILGGAETNLWEVSSVYCKLARVLQAYHSDHKIQGQNTIEWNSNRMSKDTWQGVECPLDAGSIYLTMEALTEVNRPSSEFGWTAFSGSKKIAWKTGTSIGYRDAWAVGVTPEYVVAVWVGNADGEGRPGLVGVQSAAPILFDVFDNLPQTSWFKPPYDQLREASVCSHSGLRAGGSCRDQKISYMHKNARRSDMCRYHRDVFVDESETYEVFRSCYHGGEVKQVVQFELPPSVAWYYRRANATYETPRPLHPDCRSHSRGGFDVIYPQDQARIHIPRNMDSETEGTIFEVAHQNPETTVYWHLDDKFVGKTINQHRVEIHPTPGHHHLRVVDEYGDEMNRMFEVIQ